MWRNSNFQAYKRSSLAHVQTLSGSAFLGDAPKRGNKPVRRKTECGRDEAALSTSVQFRKETEFLGWWQKKSWKAGLESSPGGSRKSPQRIPGAVISGDCLVCKSMLALVLQNHDWRVYVLVIGMFSKKLSDKVTINTEKMQFYKKRNNTWLQL